MEKKSTKKRSLRDELITAGIQFLKDHSPRELTMRKIASLCKVTPHAIYNHFKNKAELIAAINERVLNDMATYTMEIVLQPSVSFFDKFEKLVFTYRYVHEKYPYYLESLSAVPKKPSFHVALHGEERFCEMQFSGWPSLKTLVQMENLPIAYEGFHALTTEEKLQYVSQMRPFAQSDQESELEASFDQLLMLVLVNGFPNIIHDDLLPAGMSPEQLTRMILVYVFKRVLQ